MSKQTNTDEKYMACAIALAYRGLGGTYPNPAVGCVIVSDGNIIGQGYHHRAGQPHAEVNAITSVENKSLLAHSTLYVTLEPCAHYGKTPPCADMIVAQGIPRVVVGVGDPFAQVNGLGIRKMQEAGIDVTVGVLENECRELNKRFFTFHQKKRPYVFLKWARTSDGFIDAFRDSPETPPLKITGEAVQRYVHRMRSLEQAIMVGTHTTLLDNPRLDARLDGKQKNPLRITIDKDGKIPPGYHLKDGSIPTLIFTASIHPKEDFTEYIPIDPSRDTVGQVLEELYRRDIQSLIVEGGAALLHSFIARNLWDEAYVFTAPQTIGSGVKAPEIPGSVRKTREEGIGPDRLDIYKNPDA